VTPTVTNIVLDRNTGLPWKREIMMLKPQSKYMLLLIIVWHHLKLIFTATCFSNVAVMGSLDVRPSVCDVDGC